MSCYQDLKVSIFRVDEVRTIVKIIANYSETNQEFIMPGYNYGITVPHGITKNNAVTSLQKGLQRCLFFSNSDFLYLIWSISTLIDNEVNIN